MIPYKRHNVNAFKAFLRIFWRYFLLKKHCKNMLKIAFFNCFLAQFANNKSTWQTQLLGPYLPCYALLTLLSTAFMRWIIITLLTPDAATTTAATPPIIIPDFIFTSINFYNVSFFYSYNKVEINIIIRFSFCDILLLQVYINLLIFSLLFRRR